MENSKELFSEELKTVTLPVEVYRELVENSKVISLLDIIQEVWKAKFIVIFITSGFICASIFLSLNISNQYKSETILQAKSSEGSDGLASIASQFGGLASLAGLNIGGDNSSLTTTLEILKSKKFIIGFIKRHSLQVPVIASEGWIFEKDELIIDQEIFSSKTNVWVREVSYPKRAIPSDLELYEKFMDFLKIEQDQDTSLVNMSIVFYSPTIAKHWLELLVEDINAHIKEKDRNKALISIKYLENEIQETDIASNRNILFQIMEEQQQKLMITEITDEYAFEIIDPAFVAEKKHSPQRALIVIGMTMLGFLFSLLTLFIYSVFSNKQKD